MENILLIRLKSMGDVVLTLPAFHAVREQFPKARIAYLTSRENSVLLRGFAGVDEVIILDREKLRGGNPLKIVPEFLGLLCRLRFGRFSLVLDFQGYGETAWLTRITGAPKRGSSFYHPRRQWAYTFGRDDKMPLHAADAHLELLRRAGLNVGQICNQFSLPGDASLAAKTFLSASGLDPQKPTLFIQALTSGSHKNWPIQNYLTVARHWRDCGIQVIFGGGPADKTALQPAADEKFCVAAGVPLLVTGALVDLSTVILGGDTGILHLAVALAKRVVMLMHQAVPGSPIPYQHPDWVIPAPEPEAIERISINQVNAMLGPMLNAPAGNVSG